MIKRNSILLISLVFILISCKGNKPAQDTFQRAEIIQPQKWWENLPRPIYSSLERIKVSQKWYEVYQLTDDTLAFYEPFQFEEAISYLLLGKETAILIDTGTGIGNLRKLVTELTDLPVSVVNTHTHWDHLGANHQFDTIICFNHPECIDKLLKGVDNTRLRPSITGDSIWKPLPEELDPIFLGNSIDKTNQTFGGRGNHRFGRRQNTGSHIHPRALPWFYLLVG